MESLRVCQCILKCSTSKCTEDGWAEDCSLLSIVELFEIIGLLKKQCFLEWAYYNYNLKVQIRYEGEKKLEEYLNKCLEMEQKEDRILCPQLHWVT